MAKKKGRAMPDPASQAIQRQAALELLVISEIMTVLATAAENTNDMVPAS